MKFSTTLHLTFSRYGDRINPLQIKLQTNYQNIFSQIENIKDIKEEILQLYEDRTEEISPSNMVLDSIN